MKNKALKKNKNEYSEENLYANKNKSKPKDKYSRKSHSKDKNTNYLDDI